MIRIPIDEEVTKKVTCQGEATLFGRQRFLIPELLPVEKTRNPQLIREAGVSELASPKGIRTPVNAAPL
jgi:hypothetical protein